MAYGITDEIFAVASVQPFLITPAYMGGLIFISALGWSLGTFLGAACGQLFSAAISDALGIVLYGMFLAIIIPPARENRVIAALVVISMLASCAFAYLPVVSAISPGTRVIILTVAISAAAAYLFPVKEEDGHAA